MRQGKTAAPCIIGGVAWSSPGNIQEARAQQETLRRQVVAKGRPKAVGFVAGLDAHYQAGEALVWGAVAVLDWPGLQLVESALACQPLEFPYVPGLLSFREGPALLAALACLTHRPDLLFVDGQGIAHPRRLGLASHIGVLVNIPTIGVAKSRLFGRFEPPASEKGAWSRLTDGDEVIGAVVRTRKNTRRVFISIGQRIDLEVAIDLVLQAAPRYRIPEPIRLADRLSRMHCR